MTCIASNALRIAGSARTVMLFQLPDAEDALERLRVEVGNDVMRDVAAAHAAGRRTVPSGASTHTSDQGPA
jgi:hypothetical protein